MPPTKDLIDSPYLWQYIEYVALPVLRHHLHFRNSSRDLRAYESELSSTKVSRRKMLSGVFGRERSTSMPNGEGPSTSATIELAEDVLDMLEDVFTHLSNMALFEEAQSSHGWLIKIITEVVENILNERLSYPTFFEAAFKEFTSEKRQVLARKLKEYEEVGGAAFEAAEAEMKNVDVLTLVEFKQLMHEIIDLSRHQDLEKELVEESADDKRATLSHNIFPTM